MRRRAALDRVHERLQKRLADKQRTTDNLIAGRLRFAEAVTEFRTINEAGGSELTFSMPRHPNDTVDVISARNVAYWAISMLRFHHADEKWPSPQVSKDLRTITLAYCADYAIGIENGIVGAAPGMLATSSGIAVMAEA